MSLIFRDAPFFADASMQKDQLEKPGGLAAHTMALTVGEMSMAVHSMDTRWTLDGHSIDTTIDTTIDTGKTARLLRFTTLKREN